MVGPLVFLTSLASAQTRDYGSFIGTVFDMEGTRLPGVTITAKNLQMGITQVTVTNDQGRYRIERLPRGTYAITASLQGFKTTIKGGLELSIGGEVKVDFVLEAGKLEEEVTVVGKTPMVETTRAQVSTVITQKEFLSYPQGNRNFASLIAYAPGTLPVGWSSGFAINGQRANSNNFTIDGIDNNELWGGNGPPYTTTLPPEAIDEFRLVSNNFSAEYGRNTGGIINTVMKSGTNELHGSAWAFYRGDSALFQTADWLTQDRPPYKRNQYGFTIGGPIAKDKTFFFFTFEGLYEKEENLTPNLIITPEAWARAVGSAKYFYDNYGAYYPKPTYGFIDIDGDGSNDAGYYPWFYTIERKGYNAGVKIDHIFSGKDRLSFRWLYNYLMETQDTIYLPGYPQEFPDQYHTGGFTWLHLFSPTMYNEVRLGCHLDYWNVDLVAPDLPNFGFFDGVASIWQWDKTSFERNTYQLMDVLNFQKGNHSLKVGGEARLWTANVEWDANGAGYYVFNDCTWFLNDYGAYYLLMGADPPDPPEDNPYVSGSGTGQWQKGDTRRKWRGLEGGLFIQDDWRITDRLTLSLGLRWEYFGVPKETSGHGISMPAFGTKKGYENTIAGNYDITEGQYNTEGIKYLIFDGRELNGEGLWNSYYKAFAPRISFAYDLTGDGKTSLRGGWGISYDRIYNNIWENDIFNYPDYTFAYFLATPWIHPTFPATIPSENAAYYDVSLRWMQPDLLPQKAYNWLLGIQREFGANMMVEVSYTGSAGRNLGSIQRPNRYTGDGLDGSDDGINPYVGIRSLNFREQTMKSDYSALTITLNKRFSRGWSWYTAYTYGTAKDQQSDYGGGYFSMEAVSDERPGDEYGYADYDYRHRMVGGFVWDMPLLKHSKNWVLRNIVAGWQISGNFHWTSARAFPIRGGNWTTDWNYDGSWSDRPLWTGGNYDELITDVGGRPGWDYSKFGVPSPPKYAEDMSYYSQNFTPRNAFRWFPTYNLDIAFQKYFTLPMGAGRDMNIQLIAEVFNVFHWLFWDLPGIYWGYPDFGYSERKSGVRRLQLSVRVMF